jgi:hypothetical protein
MMVRFVQSGTPQYIEIENDGKRVPWEPLSKNTKFGCMVLSSALRVDLYVGAACIPAVALLLRKASRLVSTESSSDLRSQHSYVACR